jgi:hypothetical protein
MASQPFGGLCDHGTDPDGDWRPSAVAENPLQNMSKPDLLGSPPPPPSGAALGTKTPGFSGPIDTRLDGFFSEGHIANRDRKPLSADERSDALFFCWLPALPIGFGSFFPSMECHAALRQDWGNACLLVLFSLLVIGQHHEFEDIGIEIPDACPNHPPGNLDVTRPFLLLE